MMAPVKRSHQTQYDDSGDDGEVVAVVKASSALKHNVVSDSS